MKDRVCDSCFNGLCHAASQPSPDHFNVKQLKQCALSLIITIQDLIESLIDPDRSNRDINKDFNNIIIENNNNNNKNKNNNDLSISKNNSYSPTQYFSSVVGLSQIEILKVREKKLYESEDNIAKYLSVI